MNVKKLQLLSFALPVFMALVFVTSCKTGKNTSQDNKYTPPVIHDKPEIPVIQEVTADTVKSERVDLLVNLIMPFELKANLTIEGDVEGDPQIVKSSLPALNFYEGAMLAVDSVNNESRSLSVRAYEAPSDSLGLLRIFNNRTFGEPAIIIATLPNSLISAAANIAARRKLKILFTQASNNTFLNANPNLALAYTSTITQCREAVKMISKRNMDANVILVFRKVKREDELANVFREELEQNLLTGEVKLYDATNFELENLVPILSTERRNLVYIISSDEAFVSPVLTLLNEQEIFGIHVAGLPTWQNFESINFMAFENLRIFVFENNFIEHGVPGVDAFRKSFITKYHSFPLPAAFNGFDLLYRIGTGVDSLTASMESIIDSAFQSGAGLYDFKRIDEGGFENTKISILQYVDYKLEKLPDLE